MSELGAFFGLLGLIGLFWIVIVGLLVGLFIFWILMIVDVAQRKFPEHNQQLVWILVVVLASYIGAIIYYFVVKRKDTPKVQKNSLKRLKSKKIRRKA